MRELFRQVSDPHHTPRSRRMSALPVSIAVHAIVLAAVVVIPLLASDVLPAVRLGVIFEPVAMPAAPEPPPAAPVHRPLAPQPAAAVVPLAPPDGVGRENRLVADPLPDVAAPGSSGVILGDVPAGFGAGVVAEPPPPRPVAPVPVRTLIRPPVKVHDVVPVYPDAARLARIEGIVIIEAVIGQTGDVIEARVLRSKPLLEQAAVDAVRQWRYTPTLLNGVPVPVVMTVTVNFTLK